jgi:hypothetical protein
VQLTTQPGSCSPPPGTYRSGAIISLLLCRCSSVRLRNTRLLSIWTGANEAVGNMKLFNNHSGLRGLPCLAEGIYWATGLSRTTPFTEGRLGVNNKASPPGRHQEQAPKQRCTFSSTTFSSVQFSSCHHTFSSVRSSSFRVHLCTWVRRCCHGYA